MLTITSTTNPYIKELKTLSDKKGRRSGRFIAEGEKCAFEALSYGEVERLLVTDPDDPLVMLSEEKGVMPICVTDAVMSAVSGVKTPPGAIAVAVRTECSLPSPHGLFVALEDVADPQNVGAIIRTADAAGAACVLVSSGSADYTSPRAVRASMGSVFHLPIVVCESLYDTLSELKHAGMCITGTHLKGSGELGEHSSVAAVIGNEARGMSDRLSSLCDVLYKIPMRGRAESLNAAVAAGIVIYRLSDRLCV